MREHADSAGLVLVAPKSRTATWDVLAGGYGPDVANIDRLVGRVSRLCPVGAYTVGGFSDGASYALSLGITNGDLFDSVIAFSPGFDAAEDPRGTPRFFISHGTQDPVLPIDRCSRVIVPALRDEGYDVTYEEFDGVHEIPPEIRDHAAQWLVDG
jgi:predicted esterase